MLTVRLIFDNGHTVTTRMDTASVALYARMGVCLVWVLA